MPLPPAVSSASAPAPAPAVPDARDRAGPSGGSARPERNRSGRTGAAPRTPTSTVVACYDLLSLSLLLGIEDYTDGIYHGNRATSYATAQRNQHEYLLDQLGVTPGFRLLDVGCGSGSLLRRAKERGADAVGITLSPPQVALGRARKLDIRLINYLDLPVHFGREFDGIVANGSIEHFCQPEAAARGAQDAVYRRMFELFFGALRVTSTGRRLATTVIHFRDAPVPPAYLLQSPFRRPFDRHAFHFGILNRSYGGYYPAPGQLARCAHPWFELAVEQHGTEDYHLTSEHWLARLRQGLRGNAEFRRELWRAFVRRPRHTTWFLLSFFGAQSWPWQFRGAVPPTILLRQTWRAT